MKDFHHHNRLVLLKEMKALLKYTTEEPKKTYIPPKLSRIISLILLLGILLTSSAASAYTDQQLANAIRKSEGTWTYGIKTVKCESEKACREVCLRTIRNNVRRFTQYGYKNHPDFISFLGSRYCPTHGTSLSTSEQRLNKNWVKNVRYFLSQEVA